MAQEWVNGCRFRSRPTIAIWNSGGRIRQASCPGPIPADAGPASGSTSGPVSRCRFRLRIGGSGDPAARFANTYIGQRIRPLSDRADAYAGLARLCDGLFQVKERTDLNSAACGTAPGRAYPAYWRRGRVAEGGGLLNRYRLVKAYRGFESLRLRHAADKSFLFMRLAR
jgi:hypothetical protein